jgi:hypothetical protein
MTELADCGTVCVNTHQVKAKVRSMMNTFFNKQLLMVVSVTCGMFAGAPFTRAAKPVKPVVNVQQLAITESVLQFCGPVDADAAKKLQDKLAKLVQGASDEELAQARESDDYRHAYDFVAKMTAQVDEHHAKAACTDQLADSK